MDSDGHYLAIMKWRQTFALVKIRLIEPLFGFVFQSYHWNYFGRRFFTYGKFGGKGSPDGSYNVGGNEGSFCTRLF